MKMLITPLCAMFFLCLQTPSLHAVQQGWQKHSIGSQKSPIYLDVKDMDGDGDLDIASTTNMHPGLFDSEVAWFRNTGSSWEKIIISSSSPEDSPITNANGIAIADIDGDGLDDVVVGTGRAMEAIGSVYWFRAPVDASGTWERFVLEKDIPSSYFKIYTLDVDSDGDRDIIAGGEPEGAAIFFNPGDADQPGATWNKIMLPTSGYKTGSSLYLADVNGDGTTDILNTYTGEETGDPGTVSSYSIVQDNGTVAFTRTLIDPEVIRPFDINTMDVNTDGKPDVLVSTFKQKKLYWYEQPANDNDSWTQHVISNSFDGTDIFTGDINADGNTDFVIAGLFQANLVWFEYNKANRTWTDHSIDYILLPGDVSLNDIDGDGDLDVVLAGMGTNQIIWYENKLNEQQGCVLSYVLGKDSPRIESFRNFRDTVMVTIPGGGRLVDAYYRYSPALIQCVRIFKNIL